MTVIRFPRASVMISKSLNGECQCGQVQYSILRDASRLHICHCLDCQKQSGSAFGMSLIIQPETFQLNSGELSTFLTSTASGHKKTCAFCPNCGVRIYNKTHALMAIKAGTLDDTSQLSPDAHYWTKRKQPWVVLPDDIQCFEEVLQ